MFISLIVVGFIHGFMLLPLFLSLVGPEKDNINDEDVSFIGDNRNWDEISNYDQLKPKK